MRITQKKSKYFLGFSLLIIALLTPFFMPARAQNAPPPECNDPETAPFGCFETTLPGMSPWAFVHNWAKSGLIDYTKLIVNFVTVLIIAAGLIAIIIGGYLYMTAGGSAERVGTAKTVVASALLGIALALAAWLILNTISPQFTNPVEPRDLLPKPAPAQPGAGAGGQLVPAQDATPAPGGPQPVD